MKTYKITIEVNDNFFDPESPIIWASHDIKDKVLEEISTQVSKEIIKKGLPKINIPNSEIRKAVKERMVDDIMEGFDK